MCRCRTRCASPTRSSSAGTRFPAARRSAALHVARRLAARRRRRADRCRRPPPPATRPGVPPPIARALSCRSLGPGCTSRGTASNGRASSARPGPVDVCHSTIAIPAATKAPHVVTVHDVAFVRAPERFTAPRRAGDEGRARALPARRPRAVPERATIADLVELGFDERRIRHVPWGVEAAPVTDADVDRVRATYALPERFVLFVGTVEPRKNLARLADASPRARSSRCRSSSPERPGGATPARDEVDVRFLGFVPERDLPGAVRERDGVRLPEPRTRASGCPSSRRWRTGCRSSRAVASATEEIAGGAAVLVDAVDVDSIRDGLARRTRRRTATGRSSGVPRAGRAQLGGHRRGDRRPRTARSIG